MRKILKRGVCLLLVLVMVLGMLPAGFAAVQSYTATPITGVPEGGSVVIYSPKAAGVFGATIAGGVVSAAGANATEEGGMTVYNGTGIYKLTKNADGSYYITCGGQYLTCDTTSTVTFTDEPTTGSDWLIQLVNSSDASEGCFIINVDRKYNGKDLYLEYYNGFKPYSYSTNYADCYPMFFYAIDAAEADADGDGYVGEKPEDLEKPQDGDKVVIYNDYGGAAMGPQSDDSVAPSLTMIDAAVSGGELQAGNGALVFTVHTDGTYYTFENDGKYLRTSENQSDGSNAECLYFDETESDYTKWTLDEVDGGYILYNKIATYKGNAVCIEFFNNGFSGWTYNGSLGLFAMRFFEVEDPLDLGFVLNPALVFEAGDAYQGSDYTFTVNVDDLTEVKSLNLQYQLDNDAAVDLQAASVDGMEYTYTISKAALIGKTTLKLTATAVNEYDMIYDAETTVSICDEPLILSVMPAVNAGTGSDKQPEIGAVIANCGENPTVVMTVGGEPVTPTVTENKISYVPAEAMTDGKYVVSIEITRADGKQIDTTWSFFIGEAGVSLYYGQLHSHTAEYSDGAGTLEDAYEYAMQADDIDFLFVTDHSNYFDTTSTATMSSYYDVSSLKVGTSGQSTWEEAKQTADYYTSLSSDFIAGYGYEMTWSGGPGHTNTFNTYGTVSRNNATLNDKSDSYAGMHLYNDLMVKANKGLDVDGNAVADGLQTKWIEDAPVISQFNHPGTTFGNFDDFAGYTPSRDTVLNLIEVGNGEGAVGGSSYWPSYSQYDLALAKGWHVAPTNNQDNHKGKWGDSNTCRDVVLSESFTEAALYEAMAERRLYATEDQNLAIYYYLNDFVMGSIISLEDGEEPETVDIACSISDPDGEGLGKIEIIGANGVSLASYNAPNATYELNVTIDNTDPYYYIKVTQADGDIAVTAPVWVGESIPVTCAVDNEVAMSLVGQEETITAELSNAAELPYTVTNVTFSLVVGGETTVLQSTDYNDTVASGGTKSYTLDFTPEASGVQTIQVLFTGLYDGKTLQCASEIKIEVYEADNLVKVAIDKGHDNYYVSGDYAGNDTNLVDFCAANGASCEYIEAGEFTYETLKQYDLVLLTVPYRRNTAKATMYTDDEVAALKQYTDNGGNVIICSKSDRDNKYDNCAANSNVLLEAIGANTRVVDGIIVDNEMKASEAYRLYFSALENFNTEHPFTAGAYTSSNAYGTTPSGSNQTGFQLYNGAPLQVLDEDKVDVLVQGYQSTWGSHYDGYFTGGSFVPVYDETDDIGFSVAKGDVNIMTYEDLAGGGWVITSGVTFFSNYDIKDDQDYANKFILRNILFSLRDDAAGEISTIAEVHECTEEDIGKEFTVEGIVTSNASGYDQDTAFFDCIYVQDETGGINVFPVSGNYRIGQKVRVHGFVKYYCGEIELSTSESEGGWVWIVGDGLTDVEPADVTCAQAMSDDNIGRLMRVTGKITEIHETEGVIDRIYVEDGFGDEAMLFINSYIMTDYTGLDELEVGMYVSGVGIGSRDVDETDTSGSGILKRLRVRDRAEICAIHEPCGDGHSFVEVERVDPTATEAGYIVWVCAICGETYTEPLPPTGTNNPFTDVDPDQYYFEPVLWAVENGITTGTSATTFRPDQPCTRAQIVTFLWRAAGEPEPTATNNPFVDVAPDQYYYKAVLWAVESGITTGTSATTFRPDQPCTRAQVVTFLWRSKGKPTASADNVFTDVEAGQYYYDAVLWAVEAGVTTGASATIFAPDRTCTRAQIVTFLYRAKD